MTVVRFTEKTCTVYSTLLTEGPMNLYRLTQVTDLSLSTVHGILTTGLEANALAYDDVDTGGRPSKVYRIKDERRGDVQQRIHESRRLYAERSRSPRPSRFRKNLPVYGD